MNHRMLLLAILFALVSSSTDRLSAEPTKTNFVFFLVDDLGWADVGAFGSKYHETPNIDGLAATGMKFTNGYAACPVCSPTRASIMTGRHPVRVDITDWLPGMNGARAWNAKFLHLNDAEHLALKEVTIAEVLKQNGYQTFFAGKWHLGSEGHLPTDQGFDINIGGHHRGSPPGGYYAPWTNPYLKSKKEGEYLTERLTEESIKFLNERKREQPFLLYLSYYNVHTPIQPYKKRVGYYEEKAAKLYKDQPAPAPRKERDGVSRMRQDSPAYASMVAAVDDSVGGILNELERLGLNENTVVIFFSDNGGLCTVRGNGPTSNLPLRSGKGWLYEGGVREPMIIRAPGVTQPGSVNNDPVVSMDFFPTMLELAGLPARPELHVDGNSLVPLLKGGSQAERDLFWHYAHYHGSMWRPGASVRSGDWKLIEFYEYDEVELYNLKDDIGEQKDLSKTNPEKTKEMRAKLKSWQVRLNAKMPEPNPKFDPNAPPRPPAGFGKRPAGRGQTQTPAKLKLKGVKVQASSFEAGNFRENAFDGNDGTRWAANGGTVPQWFQLELPQLTPIRSVTIHWQNNTWYKYVVESSQDAKTWTTAAEQSLEQMERVQSHRIDSKFRYLRIKVSAAGAGWVSIREIDLK